MEGLRPGSPEIGLLEARSLENKSSDREQEEECTLGRKKKALGFFIDMGEKSRPKNGVQRAFSCVERIVAESPAFWPRNAAICDCSSKTRDAIFFVLAGHDTLMAALYAAINYSVSNRPLHVA